MPPVPLQRVMDEVVEDEKFFQLEEDLLEGSHFKTVLPIRQLPVLELDTTSIPASRLRGIAREVSERDYDSQTVFRSCQGLTRGTSPFDEAYAAARIRSFAKSLRIVTDPYLSAQLCIMNPAPETQHTPPRDLSFLESHPMAVIYLGQLMAHFGIWVIALLGVQVWCSWQTAGFANEYLEGGQALYFGIALVVMLALDTGVWFSRRGKLSQAFHFPGVTLFLFALIPAFFLYLRGVLQFT
jgi:hypothetical protein